LRFRAKLLGHGNEVRLMRLEKMQDSGEQRRFAQPVATLVGPNSGQVEKALRPTLIAERCGKRSEG